MVYNSLTRSKEVFQPIHPGHVGMYVCGPTVYNDVHLGNVRSFVSFDVIYRFLKYLGYRVRYVRNITDVGHLLDDGEDRISKRARIEKLEPLEIVQKYTVRFHEMMRIFNNLPPDIEPRATAHIIEQIEMVQQILDNGFAYVSNGSVYFDIQAYLQKHPAYGRLSGRKLEELLAVTREELKGVEDKKHPADFALWMKASPEHIMRWKAPWSVGFPGWHLECSVMSTKYLGDTFDIHGGGNDLKFPHHENEIAQNKAAKGVEPAKYWLHTNMLLMHGRKMSKSEGNTITPYELLSGTSPHISRAYSAMAIRFFFLQSHYRSTVDISDEALQAAARGYRRLMEGIRTAEKLQPHPNASDDTPSPLDDELQQLCDAALREMLDDFNTPRTIATLFELINRTNALYHGKLPLKDVRPQTIDRVRRTLRDFAFDILGLKDETTTNASSQLLSKVMDILLDLRQQARREKNYALADLIRQRLAEAGIQLQDGPDGTTWTTSESQ